jgi:phospholipid-binding lipoprotein MlaA
MRRFLKTSLCIGLLCSYTSSFAIYESQALVNDRFENYNRNAYRMNDTLDRNFVRPTAVFYITYVPSTIRTGIQNFFNNLRDFVTLGNDILQLDGISSMHNVMRIAINSTFGILGLIDISTSLGLEQHKNSFGNTFKVYGWTNSSYFVIPLLGPSTVRDAIGLIPDTLFNPTWWIIPRQYDYVSVGLFGVNAIDQRAAYLDYDQLLNTSLDPYATLRDTYLQGIGESIPQAKNSNDVSIDNLLNDESK